MKNISKILLLSLFGMMSLASCGTSHMSSDASSDTSSTPSSVDPSTDSSEPTSEDPTSVDPSSEDPSSDPGSDTTDPSSDPSTDTSSETGPGTYGDEIRGYVHDDKSLIQSVSLRGTLDDSFELLSPITDGDTVYYNLRYGYEATFVLQDSGYVKATGLKVDDATYTATDGAVSFTVELDDLSDYFLSITPTYEDTTPITGDYTFDVSCDSHLSATVYASDKSTVINGANQSDLVYIKVESNDEQYSVKSVTVKARNSDIGSAQEATVTYSESEDLYHFTTPYAYDNIVHIEIKELDNSLLKDTGVAGTYLPISISSATHSISSFVSDKYLTVNNGGEMSYYSSTGYGTTRSDIVSEVRDGGILYTESYSSVLYGKNLIFTNQDGETGMRSPFGSYDLLCVRKQSSDDLDAIYTVKGERMVIDSVSYVAVNVYRSDELYATAFIDYGTKNAYFNPDFRMYNGTYINDAEAVYSVTDGEKAYVIGYDGDGGYASRCLITSGVYGKYVNGDDVLNVTGLYKAAYLGEVYDYALDGSNITLTKGNRTVVLSLDLDARTFTLVSDTTEEAVDLPEFAGKSYCNNYAFEDDNFNYGFYVAFSSTDMTLSCNGSTDYPISLDSKGNRYAHNTDVAYTYDATAKTVTANLIVKGGATKAVTFTYTGTAFTLSSSVIGNGSFYSTTATLSEVK